VIYKNENSTIEKSCSSIHALKRYCYTTAVDHPVKLGNKAKIIRFHI